MAARSFDFMLGKRKRWAQGHANKHPSVTLALPGEGFPACVDVSVSMSPAEAHAMAVALEAAATWAENVIADTGLGESAVDAAGADGEGEIAR